MLSELRSCGVDESPTVHQFPPKRLVYHFLLDHFLLDHLLLRFNYQHVEHASQPHLPRSLAAYKTANIAINKVSTIPHNRNVLLAPLANLAVVFRSPGQHRTTTSDRLMDAFWTQLTTPAAAGPNIPGSDATPLDGYGQDGPYDPDDPCHLISYLFNRIAGYDLSQDQVDPVSG